MRTMSPFLILCLTCLTMSAAASPAVVGGDSCRRLRADNSENNRRQESPPTITTATEVFVPRRPRSEADRDHLEALSLWAAGRSHEHDEQYAEALHCYQRAHRFDPRSPEIVQAIVPLADRLNRDDVAARYALIDVELKGVDPLLLRRLGVYLTGEGAYSGAATLYEKAVAVRKHAGQSAADVFLRMELGRLYLLSEQYKRAADCFAFVTEALDHPDRFGLDDRLRKGLLDDPAQTYQLLGETFLAADRPADARTAFEKAGQYAPAKAMRQYNLARVYAKTGKPAEALKALDAGFAERLSGQGMDPYQTLADVLDKLGKQDELIGRLEKLHAAEPDNLPLGYFLAARLRDAGKDEQAGKLYRKLLDAKPMPTGYRGLADILRRSKRYEALLDLLGESVEKIGVLDSFGGVIHHLTAKPEAVREVLQAAERRAGKSSEKIGYDAGMAAALLALEAKQYEPAGRFFRLALERQAEGRGRGVPGLGRGSTVGKSPGRGRQGLPAGHQ